MAYPNNSKPIPPSASTDEATHVAQELYKQNLELAERNKTLALLRKIDEIVLSSDTELSAVSELIADTVVSETSFIMFTALLVIEGQQAKLVPYAASYMSSGASKHLKDQEKIFSKLPIHAQASILREVISEQKHIVTDTLSSILSSSFPAETAQQIQGAMAIKSFYIYPLVSRSKVIGVMILGVRVEKADMTAYQNNLLERLAGVAAIAVDNSMLFSKTQVVTARLKEANRHLKDLDKAKDEFISMASHQLRTPLTTIKGYLSMMLEGDAGKITPTQKQFVGYAFEGADRMVNLIADLLNVSRLSAGRFMIEAKPSDLGKIVEDEVRQLQSHASAKNLELTYHPPKHALPMIPLDDNKTRQVIMNFIDNAIYYTKAGSISVAVTKVDTAIRVTVQDTGIGVPLDARRKLFSKFYRADNAQTVRPDGTGLGLYLAKRVIEDQGGTIIFESVEGKGSTFGFELPLSAPVVPTISGKKVPTT